MTNIYNGISFRKKVLEKIVEMVYNAINPFTELKMKRGYKNG